MLLKYIQGFVFFVIRQQCVRSIAIGGCTLASPAFTVMDKSAVWFVDSV